MGNLNKDKVNKLLEELIYNYKELEPCKPSIWNAFLLLRNSYNSGRKLMICGNGGSASDSEHIVGELMKGFLLKRPLKKEESNKIKAVFPDEWEYLSGNLQGALPAISLVSHSSLISAYSNDIDSDMVYAQQVYGYGKEGDVLLGISTSGDSKNIINAIKIAKAFGLKTIGLTGKSGGKMKGLCDVLINVPALETHKVQEFHLPVYHTLCAMLEVEFFDFY